MTAATKMANARTWQQWVKLINGAWQKGVASIVETGELLIQAKEEIGHGSYESMVGLKLNFSPGTARKLVSIAGHPILSNRSNWNDLPAIWTTLYQLTKVDKKLGEGTLLAMIKDGRVNPKTQQKDVAAMLRAEKVIPIKPSGPDKAVAKSSAALIAALKGKSRYQMADIILDVIEKCELAFHFVAQREHQRGKASGKVTDIYFGTELPDSTPSEDD